MAYPTEINALPANPETFSPNSLRQMYTTVRTAVQSIVAAPLVSSTKTASYTLVLADADTLVEMNSASATTVTVPLNSAAAFPVGTVIEIFRYGAGTVTINSTGGVTLHSPGELRALRVIYSSAVLRKRGTDEWIISGDLV